MSSKKKLNKWMMLSLVLGVLLIISIALNASLTGSSALTEEEASSKLLTYLNTLGSGAQVLEINKTNGLYNIKISLEETPYSLYMTMDGSLLFPQVINLDAQIGAEEAQVLPKTDKPSVELFVMSECPFGTQTEKGILPVLEALGDKADFKLRFVYYLMHGEPEAREQVRQYCIQEEQNDKFLSYLSCYLEAGNSSDCLTRISVDTTKLDECVSKTDTQFDVTKNLEDKASWLSGVYPLFNIDKELNEQYVIGGSPTIVINGISVGGTLCSSDSDCNSYERCAKIQNIKKCSLKRDPASLLDAVCSSFNTAPAECNTQLSSSSPTPGFGYQETGADTSATCS